MTQKSLAKETCISQSLIAKIESGKVSPSYSIVKKIFNRFEQVEHNKDGSCLEMAHKKIVSIKPSETVRQAADLMRKNAVSQLPVLEKSRVVGNISEEIIYNKILEGESKDILFKKQIKTIMEDPLPIISASTPKSVAMPLLKTNSAILLTEKDKIIGILTKEDFIIKS